MSKKSELILLIAVLIIAAFLRLYRIADYMTFLGDEGRDALVVKRMIVDHKFTLLGPTASVGGFFLGPLYYYLMLPFLWAFRLNPVGPAVMVALFGIATVWLVYRVSKDFFNSADGGLVGLAAAFLYALSPLVIYHSRSSWNPNLMPFFSLLIIWVSWKAVEQKKPALLLLIGFLFGLLIQFHYLAVFLGIVIMVYFLFNWRFKNLKYYPAALVGFIIGWFPFIIFELRHQFPNFRTLYQFVFHGKETGLVAKRFWPIVTNVSLRLFLNLVTNNQKMLAMIFLYGSLIMLFWKIVKGKQFQAKILLGFWFLLGVGLFGFYKKGIYDYYFGFMFPLPFLLVAYFLTQLGRLNKVLGGVAVGLYIWAVIANLRGFPFLRPPNRQMEQAKTNALFVAEKTGGRPFNFALITGQNSDHTYRYFLEINDYKSITIENNQNDPERKTVTDQLLVVCEIDDCKPLGHPLWEVAGFGRAEIDGEWQISVNQIFKLKHYQGEPENEKS
jgi:4-amino-4-deoxy-L-arabinose transferase-like glycosyltransferase